MTEIQTPNPLNDAAMRLAAEQAQMHAEGAIDSEDAEVAAIQKQLSDGHITPAQAEAAIEALHASRQNYH